MLFGKPLSSKSETSWPGGQRHAGYFWHRRHRNGKVRRGRGWDSRTAGGMEGRTLSCSPWPGMAGPGVHPGTAACPARLREALASCWRKHPSPPSPVPCWGQILVPSRDRSQDRIPTAGRGERGGSWHLPGALGECPPVPAPGGSRRVKAWHWLLAAPLFSWPWRSCLPPPPSPPPSGAKPSSWPWARAGCSRLPGALRGGPAWPGRGAQPRGGPGSPPRGDASTSLRGDAGGSCPYNSLGGVRSSGAPA